MKMEKKTFAMPPDLWSRANQAALRDSAKAGKRISLSAWIRDAMERKLAEQENEQEEG